MENAIDLTIDSPPSSRKRYSNGVNERETDSKDLKKIRNSQDTKRQAYDSYAQFPDATLNKSWIAIEDDDISSCETGLELEWREIVELRKPWTDPSFPPSKESIVGNKVSEQVPKNEDRLPYCRCKLPANRATVQKDTPNKGRAYFHCGNRKCGFFVWADNRGESWADLTWKRFTSFVVVSDYGFSAKDLLQGGVGDCWFLSALAVVAERHDLIAKLFADTTPTPSGCYNIRLFLDGAWRSILVLGTRSFICR